MNSTIRDLIAASVPERIDELNTLWDEYSPQFNLVEDKTGYYCEGGPFGLILFTSRTMEILWLLGHSSMKAMDSYSAIINLLCEFSHYTFDMAMINDIPDQNETDEVYDQLMDSIIRLTQIEDISSFEWPCIVPVPTGERSNNYEEAFVFDLICISTAYVFLHEIQHVKFLQDGTELSIIDQELKCDEFARNFILEKISDYSKTSGFPVDKLKRKRGMSISLASFLLLVITPKKCWGETATHPSLEKRIEDFTDNIDLLDNDEMWIYLSCMILSHLRYQKTAPDNVKFESFKDLCLQLAMLLSK